MSLTKPALPTLFLLALSATLLAQDNTQLGFAGAAPQSQPASAETPTIQVYSRETIIDVLVTDDKGQPVRGLTKSDFTILEDNKPQPIRSFSEYDKATPPPSPRALPPNTFTNDNALPANGPVQILLLDRIASAPADLARSKQYIADYFRTMPPGTTVAIFNLSPSKGLRLLQGITSNASLAASAVDNLDVEWSPERGVGLPDAITAANQIAAYVAGFKGRKNLVWVLNGSPPLIVHDGGASWGITDPVLVRRLRDLYDTFTREQINIYALRPQGVHRLSRSTLAEAAVADATGGTFTNSNDYVGIISRIVDETRHSYTLSFVPSRVNEDGKYHPITIKASLPGVHLTYRDGYNDEQPQAPDAVLRQQMTQGPMRLGALPATQILFDLHVEPAAAGAPSATRASTPRPHKGAPYAAAFTIDPTQLV